MHECPDCGDVCDCDGEDMWQSWPYNKDCEHSCEMEEDCDDDWGDEHGDE